MINKRMRTYVVVIQEFPLHPQIYDCWDNTGFEKSSFVTSLTEVIHVSEGSEILTTFNVLELQVPVNINTGEEW